MKFRIRAATRRFAALGLLLACSLSFLLHRDEPSRPKLQQILDNFGDPLPPGAVGRLGTVRYRYPHVVEQIRFLPGGKHLVACCGDGVIHITESATGKRVRSFGHKAGFFETVSADGSLIAQATPRGVHIWSTATGELMQVFDIKCDKFRLYGLWFLDSNHLLTWSDEKLKVWRIDTGMLVRLLAPGETPPSGVELRYRRHLAVSPDGKTLVLVANGRLSTLNLPDNRIINVSIPTCGNDRDCPPASFSADGSYLSWPCPDGTIGIFRASDLEVIQVVGDPSKNRVLEEVCFSPDGAFLAGLDEKHKLYIYEAATGRLVHELGDTWPHGIRSWQSRRVVWRYVEDLGRRQLCWSPDSRQVAHAWGPGLVRVWNVSGGAVNSHLAAPFGSILGLNVSEGGKRAVTLADDNTVRAWDVPCQRELQKIVVPSGLTPAFLVDERRVLVHAPDGSAAVWQPENLIPLSKRHGDKAWHPPRRHQLTPDGTNLLTMADDNFFAFHQDRCRFLVTQHDLTSGSVTPDTGAGWLKERKKLSLGSADVEEVAGLTMSFRGKATAATIAVQTPGNFGLGGVAYMYLVRLKHSGSVSGFAWETNETEANDRWESLLFTRDDRTLVTYRAFRVSKPMQLELLEALTGKARARFEIPDTDFLAEWYDSVQHALSRDGDLLAIGTGDGATTVIDIHRNRMVTRLHGHQGPIRSLAFGVDSRTLFTGGTDGTVLIWDLREPVRQSRRRIHLTDDDFERLWAQLADLDTIKAYEGLAALIHAPTQAPLYLARKLKPVVAVPAKRIDQLVEDLGSAVFKIRDRATYDLRQCGPQAKAALQKALGGNRSLEHRRRLEALLSEIGRNEVSPSQHELRELRAVEALEAIRNAQARALLASLATGPPECRVCDEANAALERLISLDKQPRKK